MLAPGLLAAFQKIFECPNVAVGDHGYVAAHAAMNLSDRTPVRGRLVTLFFGAAVNGDPACAPFGSALGVYNAYPQPGRSFMVKAGMKW